LKSLKMDKKELVGAARCDFQYESKKGLLHLVCRGKDLIFYETPVSCFYLDAAIGNHTLTLNELQMDGFSSSFEIEKKKPHNWEVKFLSFNLNDAITMSFSGKYGEE